MLGLKALCSGYYKRAPDKNALTPSPLFPLNLQCNAYVKGIRFQRQSAWRDHHITDDHDAAEEAAAHLCFDCHYPQSH